MLSLPIHEHNVPSLIPLSALHGFQHTCPTYVLLDLHLSISLSLSCCTWYCVLISVSTCQLLVYRNNSGVLYVFLLPYSLADLTYQFQEFICIFVEIFLHRQSCHLQVDSVLCLPFRSAYCLFPFCALIILAGTSSTTLNKSYESRHPCFAPALREQAFSLSPLKIMLAVIFDRCSTPVSG